MEYISRQTTPQGDHIIQIGFFAADKPIIPCAPMYAKYSHVELRFSDNAVTSITRDPGTVHYDEGRMLSNPKYRCFFQIAIHPKQEERIQTMAREYAQSGVKFSYLAMLWNFAPITRNWPIGGFFCSQYVTTLLQAVQIACDLDPRTTSPDDLFDNLKKNPRAIASFNRCLFKLKGPS